MRAPSEIIGRAIDFFYIKPVRRLIPQEVFRYGACGGLNLILGWVLFYLFYHFIIAERYLDFGLFVVSPHTATLYCVAPIILCTGFYLNRNVAFKGSTLTRNTQLGRYILSWGLSLVFNHLLLKFFVELCGLWSTPSQIMSTLLIVVFSFLMQKYFTFRKGKFPASGRTK